MDEIPDLLRRVQETDDEGLVRAVGNEMRKYEAMLKARPNEGHVEFWKVKLRTRLRDLLR